MKSGPAAGWRDHVRWLREARAFSRVRHPNVVRLYDVGEAEGWLYLVLELVPGGTLQEGLDVAFAPRDAARLVATLAEAVAAIHGEGLVHLDLKPANIFLDGAPDGPRERAIPQVGDFGLAYHCDDPGGLTTASLAGPVGTPSYMAPEQVAPNGSKPGPAADIYGLGAIFYHLLTGHRPFAAPSAVEIFDLVRQQEPVPPRRHNSAIPRDLETICLKCLQKVPSARYASAQALGDDLKRWLNGRPITARPVSAVEKTWRTCRRHPAVAALATSLTLALAGGFLGMFLFWQHAESERMRAEAERNRAEADYKVAVRIAFDNADLTAGGDYISRFRIQDNFVETLQKTRVSLQKIAARRPDQPELLDYTGFVNQRLGHVLILKSQWDEAHLALRDSLRAYDRSILLNPKNSDAISYRVETLQHLSFVVEHFGNLAECVRLLELAADTCEPSMGRFRYEKTLFMLSDSRHRLSLATAARGEHELARSLIMANLRLIERCPQVATIPLIVSSYVFNLYGVDCNDPRPFPDSGTMSTAARTGQGRALDSRASERMPAQEWARLAMEDLHFAATPRLTRAQQSEAGYLFVLLVSEVASRQRRAAKLEEARLTAERIHAFANRLLERFPEQSFAHLALCVSFCQFKKHAWETHDRDGIAKYLKLAADSAAKSLELDPTNTRARVDVETQRRRIKDFIASR